VTALVFWLLSALAVAGALSAALTRDVMRLALGLGLLLLAVAGLFALFGFGFLALAEVFVYAGGVLVLVLFAIMLVHRGEPGSPGLVSVHTPLVFVGCAGLFAFMVSYLGPVAGPLQGSSNGSVEALGATLLGEMLLPFELAGLLLLAALVAVVSVMGGDRR
jgi:NADH:ubiquinone oxidoreductase subunit 6 (subunit J)